MLLPLEQNFDDLLSQAQHFRNDISCVFVAQILRINII